MLRVLEGILLSVVLGYIGGYIALRVIHWFDERTALRMRKAREQRHAQTYGRIKTADEVLDEGRANVLHGWD